MSRMKSVVSLRESINHATEVLNSMLPQVPQELPGEESPEEAILTALWRVDTYIWQLKEEVKAAQEQTAATTNHLQVYQEVGSSFWSRLKYVFFGAM